MEERKRGKPGPQPDLPQQKSSQASYQLLYAALADYWQTLPEDLRNDPVMTTTYQQIQACLTLLHTRSVCTRFLQYLPVFCDQSPIEIDLFK